MTCFACVPITRLGSIAKIQRQDYGGNSIQPAAPIHFALYVPYLSPGSLHLTSAKECANRGRVNAILSSSSIWIKAQSSVVELLATKAQYSRQSRHVYASTPGLDIICDVVSMSHRRVLVCLTSLSAFLSTHVSSTCVHLSADKLT